MDLLKLAIDRQNKKLVSVGGSVSAIPPLFQSNTPTLQVTVVDPTGNFNNPYLIQDMSSYGLRVSIGQTPTGTAGGPTPLTLQDTFAWISTGQYFQADLNMAVVAIDNYIGSAASASAFFEVNLTLAGNRSTILQIPISLLAVVDELTSVAPTPADQYLTKAECLALFAKKFGLAGETITFLSPTTGKHREIGVNDDGSGEDNLF